MNAQKLILTVLTPFIAAGSAWLVAAAAKYGVHLDASGVNALGVAGATAGTAAMLKLIHDLEKRAQQREHLAAVAPAPAVTPTPLSVPGPTRLVPDPHPLANIQPASPPSVGNQPPSA